MATASILQAPSLILTATPPLPHWPAPSRRKTTPVQGFALATLGHAIEYLVDSRIPDGGTSPSENEAIRMLMRCSREVFAGCTVVVPVSERVSRWLGEKLKRREA